MPEWALKITSLRNSLHLSQSEFGKRLGVSAMAVSRWERAVQEPLADAYIQLGNLTGDPLCWFFWAHAGLLTADVMRVLPATGSRLYEKRFPDVRVVHAGGQKKGRAVELVTIPLLPVRAGNAGETGDRITDLGQVHPEAMLAAPVDWCSNPRATICLRVKGNSMSPSILDGYIIAVDTSDVHRDKLVGRIVVASNNKHELIVSRLIRVEHTDALISDQRDYQLISLDHESKWRIIGKVLWWTGRAA